MQVNNQQLLADLFRGHDYKFENTYTTVLLSDWKFSLSEFWWKMFDLLRLATKNQKICDIGKMVTIIISKS